MSSKKTIKNEAIIIIVFIIFNLVTKLLHIGHTSIWLDEASNLQWALMSFKEILDKSLTDANGPIFTMLYKIWVSFVGTELIYTRLFPAIIASLTVWPLFSLGKRLFNKETGIITISIFSLASIYVQYSHDGRSYTLVTFLTVLSFLFFINILQSGKVKHLIFYALSTSLLLLTHLTPLMILPVQFFYTLLFIRSNLKNVLLSYAGMAISVGILGIWILNNNWFGGNETVWLPIPTLKDIIQLFTSYLNTKYTLVLISLVSLWIVIHRYLIKKQSFQLRKEFFLTLLWFIFPVVMIFLVSVFYNPRFLPKYMLYSVPGLYLSLGYLFTIVSSSKWINRILTSLLLVLILSGFNIKPDKAEYWEKAYNFQQKYEDNESLTVICAYYQYYSFSYYYDREAYMDYNNTLYRLSRNNICCINNVQSLEEMIRTHPSCNKMTLILSHDRVVDPEGKVSEYMKSNYNLIDSDQKLNGIQVYQYDLLSKVKPFTEDLYLNEDNLISVSPNEFSSVKTLDAGYFLNNGLINFTLTIQGKSETQLNDAMIVFTIERDDETKLWKSMSLKETKPNTVFSVSSKIEFTKEIKPDDTVKIYAWQPKTKEAFDINNISFTSGITKEYYIEKIKNDPEWMKLIEAKAKENNTTVEDQLTIDAIWMINNSSSK